MQLTSILGRRRAKDCSGEGSGAGAGEAAAAAEATDIVAIEYWWRWRRFSKCKSKTIDFGAAPGGEAVWGIAAARPGHNWRLPGSGWVRANQGHGC